MKIYGPDLSHYEPGANWKVVASDNSFGITKATEGISGTDSLFQPYWKAMGEACEGGAFVRGAYHFFHANQDPIFQVDHFLKVVGPLSKYDFVALDWETTAGESPKVQQDAARKWLHYVRAKTGKCPWLYANKSFFVENIQLPEFAQYNIWMADLSVLKIPPKNFQNISILQYTFSGKYKGVPHPCDGNYSKLSLQELKALIARP